MDKHTELEDKLFAHIRYLIGLINIYEQAFGYIYNNNRDVAKWVEKQWEVVEREPKYYDMLNELNSEFDWDAKVVKLEVNAPEQE